MRTEKEIREEIERIKKDLTNRNINEHLIKTLGVRLWALKWVLEEENYD